MTQSIMMVRLIPTEAADARGNSLLITSTRIREKLKIEIPHRM